MDADQAVIRIRAIINDLPPGEQARIAECVKRLVYLEREYGGSYKIALGLLAAEMAADARAVEEGV